MTTPLTRRRFTSAFSLATVATMLPGAALASARQEVFSNAGLGAYTQGLMTLSHFKAVLGSLFMAFLDDGSVSYMHLHAVEQIRTKSKQHGASSFYTTFKTDGKAMPQATYLLDHGTLGRFAVFLVPGQLPNGAPAVCATFCSREEAILS